MSSSRALASYANARLDDAPLCQLKLQLGVERWCCLLCRRQFRSARHIGRHLERSALHRDHLATARLHGRVSGALPATAAARGARNGRTPGDAQVCYNRVNDPRCVEPATAA